jgi:hypothetical protein
MGSVGLAESAPSTALGDALGDALDAVERFMSRFIVWPDDHCGTMAALWAAHTHVARVFYHTPRLMITALTHEAGKTRVLEVLGMVCASAVRSSSVTPSVIFTRIESVSGGEGHALPTFLLDEVDKSFDKDLVAILNDGYKAGASVLRTDFPDGNRTSREFPTFAPVAVAGLSEHRMPDDFMSRTIRIGMARKPKGASVARLDERKHRPEGNALAGALADALAGHAGFLGTWEPAMPDGLGDRSYDIWEPLIAIADAAGGAWPDKARAACLHFASGPRGRAQMTLPELLMRDTRTLFEEFSAATFASDVVEVVEGERPPIVDGEHISSKWLVRALCERDEWPYGNLRKALSVHRLANLLQPFGILPTRFRHEVTGVQARGYRWADFREQWATITDG